MTGLEWPRRFPFSLFALANDSSAGLITHLNPPLISIFSLIANCYMDRALYGDKCELSSMTALILGLDKRMLTFKTLARFRQSLPKPQKSQPCTLNPDH
jgi:hypothetical protein